MNASRSIPNSILCLTVLGLTAAFAPAAFSGTTDAPRAGLYSNTDGSPAIALIDSARSTLDIEIYTMDDSNVMDALRRAIDRGVKIRIVKEGVPVGKACRVFGDDSAKSGEGDGEPTGDLATCDEQKKLVEQVRSSGGTYEPFKRPELCGGGGTAECLQHGKLIVADSKTAMVSSGNLDATSLCDNDQSPSACNRDYSYVIDDAASTKVLREVVTRDLQGQEYDVGSLLDGDVADRLTVGSAALAPIVKFIRSARHRIQIQNQYLKDPDINNALIDRARAGVKVEVNVSSFCSFGTPKDSEKKKDTLIYKKFDGAGIQTRIFTKNMTVGGHAGYLHAKAIVVDGARAWMGSVNGSVQATHRNREFGAFFDDAADVKTLSQTMSSDFNSDDGESWQESLDCAERGKRR